MADTPTGLTDLPKVGDRVMCFWITGVTWPDNYVPRGVVTEVYKDAGQFRFMPDEPDLTSNGGGNASDFEPDVGWYIEPGLGEDQWTYDRLIIEEEP